MKPNAALSQAINPQTLVLHDTSAAINIPATHVGGYDELH